MIVKHSNSICFHLNLRWLGGGGIPSLTLNKSFCLFCLSFWYFYLHCVFWSAYKSGSQDSTLSAISSFTASSGGTEEVDHMGTSLSPSSEVPSVCQEDMCHNGGTCHPIFLLSGAFSFQCDCPLLFTGRFCEQGNPSSLSFYIYFWKFLWREEEN